MSDVPNTLSEMVEQATKRMKKDWDVWSEPIAGPEPERREFTRQEMAEHVRGKLQEMDSLEDIEKYMGLYREWLKRKGEVEDDEQA